MPRRTRGSGGAFFSRTKKQHRKKRLSCKCEEYEHLLYFFFDKTKKKYVQYKKI
jgi:hypothetical protein